MPDRPGLLRAAGDRNHRGAACRKGRRNPAGLRGRANREQPAPITDRFRLAATLHLPAVEAADGFVDDFFAAMKKRNPDRAARLPLNEGDVKNMIAAGVGRVASPVRVAAALDRLSGLARVYG